MLHEQAQVKSQKIGGREKLRTIGEIGQFLLEFSLEGLGGGGADFSGAIIQWAENASRLHHGRTTDERRGR